MWSETDARKGSHGARRMGYHGGLGNGANRARAASTAKSTTHSHGRYQEAFGARCESETVPLHLAQAKCRLFPDLDRPTIYREYGIAGDGRE